MATTTTTKEKSFCLTDTIDKTTLGNKYYHNIIQDQNNVILRPRLPIRFDMNDFTVVNMNPDDTKTDRLLRRYGKDIKKYNKKRLFQIKRTNYNITNTFLLYSLSLILIITSIVNMKKISWAIQNDTSLNTKDKVLFRLCFIFSFLVVLFLSCFVSLSVFELYKGSGVFPVYIANDFQYKDFRNFNDGGVFHIRHIILFFVVACIIISFMEIINLLFIKPGVVVVVFFFILSIIIGYTLKLVKDLYIFLPTVTI